MNASHWLIRIVAGILVSFFLQHARAQEYGTQASLFVEYNGQWAPIDEVIDHLEVRNFGLSDLISSDCYGKSGCKQSNYGTALKYWLDILAQLHPGVHMAILSEGEKIQFRFVNAKLAVGKLELNGTTKLRLGVSVLRAHYNKWDTEQFNYYLLQQNLPGLRHWLLPYQTKLNVMRKLESLNLQHSFNQIFALPIHFRASSNDIVAAIPFLEGRERLTNRIHSSTGLMHYAQLFMRLEEGLGIGPNGKPFVESVLSFEEFHNLYRTSKIKNLISMYRELQTFDASYSGSSLRAYI